MRHKNTERMLSLQFLQPHICTAYSTKTYANTEIWQSTSQDLAQPFHKSVNLIVRDTERNAVGKCQKRVQLNKCTTLSFSAAMPARSAIQLPNCSRHWKLLWLPLARVIATGADRSSVRSTATKAISISSPCHVDNTHLLFCLMAGQFMTFSPHCSGTPAKPPQHRSGR